MPGHENASLSASRSLRLSRAPGIPSLQALYKLARPILVIVPALGLVLGFASRVAGDGQWSGTIWTAATIPVLGVLIIEIIGSLRRGEVGLDIVAALSMSGALVFGEHLAAVVVALMYAGGQYLESFAERRANREMTALLARVPRTAVLHKDGRLEEVALDVIAPQDRLLVRQGDVVPVDGLVAEGVAVLDQSALTGEAVPVRKRAGEPVMSGVTNVGDAFDLSATHRAAESTYAGIVRLIEVAQRSKAPMARLADRFAMAFLALTVGLAGGAWLWSGDPIRALAVLVIATPCPLILAVPVAIVSGVSRAAKAGVLVKGGRALETLTRVRTLVIDKTGTLTHGHARIVEIRPMAGLSSDRLLQLAASLDQASKHVIAHALVSEAKGRRLDLLPPSEVEEIPGEGLEGCVDGRRVVVGGIRFVSERVPRVGAVAAGQYPAGSVVVAAAVDGEPAGLLILADPLRTDAAQVIASLRRLGIARIIVATGDRREVAQAVTVGLHLDAVHADLTPDRKIAIVQEEKPHGPVMMIGDGVNDAPALAAADLGIAMGARGAAASAEAADVVLLVDHLNKVPDAIGVARRSRRIALQSVYAGIGLSVVGMIVAGLGYLTPVQGALIQEAIDVAVILNALRALWGPEPS
ncbi:heavy metal translocating P-type ATPase [Microvirga tunisiensis]|uniref:P-type Zn(2+) transporter n=1 Tax=Microvirga tunisiensis TaxID=2108360 RepID=A0A5N7MEV6_9HYPH|nr:heavy metal translocating P-type ATPase [Microvirga tunisiensis]MPR06148.1 cadmium-translocating P-type ATPase [Microvirga tunisiensis]MPR25228.1 cadmium-translocating P-type ATPase [Microvirga tunisiensis]